jgi:hypothetical protein
MLQFLVIYFGWGYSVELKRQLFHVKKMKFVTLLNISGYFMFKPL